MMKKSPSEEILLRGLGDVDELVKLFRRHFRCARSAEPPRGDALDRVASRTDPYWLSRAHWIIGNLAKEREFLTADHFRNGLDLSGVGQPRKLNVIGAVMKIAARSGLITDTGRRTKSTRPQAHGREIRIWKSEVWNGATHQA